MRDPLFLWTAYFLAFFNPHLDPIGILLDLTEETIIHF